MIQRVVIATEHFLTSLAIMRHSISKRLLYQTTHLIRSRTLTRSRILITYRIKLVSLKNKQYPLGIKLIKSRTVQSDHVLKQAIFYQNKTQ